jgi:dihydrofolate reductase
MGKTLSIIVAIDANGAIGYQNKLLAHLSSDLKRFKSITSGHAVVMGRNTWFSLPKRPLPDRQNIVITNIPGEIFEGADTVYSIDEAIAICPDNHESFVIGGAMIYQQFFPKANKLYITMLDKSFTADTWFPEILENEWNIESESEIFFDESCRLSYQYINFIRK